MTEPLPAALKTPEVSRFINRANQLRAIKPAIAYWCEYHAVNQIVGRGLHTTDDDCFNFTRTLIERLEATKAERADDDAIVDNDAGQAYVEQFAQETFGRAERTLRANKVTRQTADTFDAAATFFDLTHEWGAPEQEILQKIKFAKWNAARILKAIREGKDPNESNPKLAASEPPEQTLQLDDPSVQQILSPRPLPASVEDVPDAPDAPHQPLVSPPPVQEEYFPPRPSAPPDPPIFAPADPSQGPESSREPPPMSPAQDFAPSAPPQIPAHLSPQSPAHLPSHFPPPFPPQAPSPGISSPPAWSPAQAAAPPAAAVPPAFLGGAPTPIVAQAAPTMNSRDINQAQKHAKWAISALNFEDVPTAISELRNALAMLGAR
ncbi:hypothetical protein CDD83_1753 [Cordyceps sp. RAO-2017]|nr:hypothetical protein CDD83_1753 [Cordyceps sp. RAO-2017]